MCGQAPTTSYIQESMVAVSVRMVQGHYVVISLSRFSTMKSEIDRNTEDRNTHEEHG